MSLSIRSNITRYSITLAMAFAGVAISSATPILDVAPNTCPAAQAVCSTTNGQVTVNLFNLFLIDPTNDTTGAYTNLFKRAFDNWNNTLAPDQKWTIVAASLSPTAEFDVTTYRAYIGESPRCGANCGGAEMRILYTPGADTDPTAITDRNNILPTDGVWSQSIRTNKKGAGNLPGNPFLDGEAKTARTQLGPPAYSFQYAGSRFFDKPGRVADATWLGQTFLTQANYQTRTLTVYDGIGWGFSIQGVPAGAGAGGGPGNVSAVPEPGSMLLAGIAILMMPSVRRAMIAVKRRSHATLEPVSALSAGTRAAFDFRAGRRPGA
jgi:hypothetical protein